MLVSKIFASCLMIAAQTYSVPPAVLLGIHQIESGAPGQEVGPNDNGTYDLGPMQINSSWLPELAGQWGVSQNTARRWVRDDVCTNVGVAAWILRRHMNETGNLARAISHYHSRTPKYGVVYRKKVIRAMQKNGLIEARR
jgi:soluble lytic murein transglycosylase-like protein